MHLFEFTLFSVARSCFQLPVYSSSFISTSLLVLLYPFHKEYAWYTQIIAALCRTFCNKHHRSCYYKFLQNQVSWDQVHYQDIMKHDDVIFHDDKPFITSSCCCFTRQEIIGHSVPIIKLHTCHYQSSKISNQNNPELLLLFFHCTSGSTQYLDFDQNPIPHIWNNLPPNISVQHYFLKHTVKQGTK